MVEKLISGDGHVIEMENNVWTVPIITNSYGSKKYKQQLDWSFCPTEHSSSLRGIGKLLTEESSIGSLTQYHLALKWYYKYSNQFSIANRYFCKNSDISWGAFRKWLEMQNRNNGKQLSLSFRRNIFVVLKKSMVIANNHELYDVSYDDIDAIAEASRRGFRDYNLLSMKHASKRAWSDEERGNLISIIREEWFAWKEWNQSEDQNSPPDLLAAAAAYLSWEETIRPSELNVMTVEDLEFSDKNRIYLHAPNKQDGWIEVDRKSFVILDALARYGQGARDSLMTNLLFVDPYPSPKVIASKDLTLRLRRLLKKYRDKYPINRDDVLLSDGRKTLGSRLASEIMDEEIVRVILRHENIQTTSIYYIRQVKEQLSKNLSTSLKRYATRLSIAYHEAVYDPTREAPDAIRDILTNNPDNLNNPYGACSNDEITEGKCEEGIHCGQCPKLIPMVSKLDIYKFELEIAIERAETATDEREIENRLAHASMLKGHIMNIEHKMRKSGENVDK